MSLNVRPNSPAHPLELEEEEYQSLVSRNNGGWSSCADEKEWLAKLHYLRSGYQLAKLDKAQFEDRETRLVVNWLIRLAR